MIEAEFLRAFSGLDIDVTLPSKPLEGPDEFEQESINVLSRMPEVFTTIQDAQMYKNILELQTSRFISSLSSTAVSAPGEGPFLGWCGPSDISSTTVVAQKFISDSISRWITAFEPLWKTLKFESNSIRLPAVILKLQVTYIRFDLLASSIEYQTIFDNYTDDFREMTDLVQYVLENSKSTKHHFHLESQVVLPLCITALRCHDRMIRMRAISLIFKYPRRGGIFDGLFFGEAI
jgi:hypothetical protein